MLTVDLNKFKTTLMYDIVHVHVHLSDSNDYSQLSLAVFYPPKLLFSAGEVWEMRL